MSSCKDKGEGGYLLISTSYNGNLSTRCLAQIIGMMDFFSNLATEPGSNGSQS